MRAKIAMTTMLAALVLMGTACDEAALEQTPDLCAQAVTYISECTGVRDPDFEAHCRPSDGERLLATSCEVLLEASSTPQALKADGGSGELSFACRVFNFGCPEVSPCVPSLSPWGREGIIALSEPTSVSGPLDVRFRVNAISELFRAEGDPRGLFATVYRLITNRAVQSVQEGDYSDPEWAHALITEFGRRYLANLHGHMTGGEITGQWDKYYRLAQNCDVGRGRTLGVAIAVHLMVDLPYTLDMIGSQPEQREDFVLFGDILLEVFPDLIKDIQADYDTDVSGLLNGFFLGEWVDGMTSAGTMTSFIYQGVRLKAWRDGQNLSRFPRWMVNSDIHTAWGLAEVALATLDAQGAL